MHVVLRKNFLVSFVDESSCSFVVEPEDQSVLVNSTAEFSCVVPSGAFGLALFAQTCNNQSSEACRIRGTSHGVNATLSFGALLMYDGIPIDCIYFNSTDNTTCNSSTAYLHVFGKSFK